MSGLRVGFSLSSPNQQAEARHDFSQYSTALFYTQPPSISNLPTVFGSQDVSSRSVSGAHCDRPTSEFNKFTYASITMKTWIYWVSFIEIYVYMRLKTRAKLPAYRYKQWRAILDFDTPTISPALREHHIFTTVPYTPNSCPNSPVLNTYFNDQIHTFFNFENGMGIPFNTCLCFQRSLFA